MKKWIQELNAHKEAKRKKNVMWNIRRSLVRFGFSPNGLSGEKIDPRLLEGFRRLACVGFEYEDFEKGLTRLSKRLRGYS